MQRTLVVAPHADDELLGCGGTMLRRCTEGKVVGWLLMTSIAKESGWSSEQIKRREQEIENVRLGLGLDCQFLYELKFPTTELDQISMSTLIARLSEVFTDFQPEELFLPHPGDVHSDHRITFDAASACSKWFRYPSIKRVLTYETLSETDAGVDLSRSFQPTVFVDISGFMDKKIDLLRLYSSEMGQFPFPRSEDALRALAMVRGAQAGMESAEAFCLLRERLV